MPIFHGFPDGFPFRFQRQLRTRRSEWIHPHSHHTFAAADPTAAMAGKDRAGCRFRKKKDASIRDRNREFR